MARLNERDFEEIRTYRAPPVSVVLVVEAVCILFQEQPIWENGQILLHRENFFQDLQFFDKENISQSNYRKMKIRLDQIDEMEVRRASMAALSLFFWLQAIAAYYQSFSKLKPLLRQRALDEAELARLQRKLGQDRVQLHETKDQFDKADCFTGELAQKVLAQRSKIRRLDQERNDALTFYDDLTFCSKEWSETKAEMALSIKNFELEMLLSSIYVFIISRYAPTESQALIESLVTNPELAKFKDRRKLLARFNGQKFENHELGVAHLVNVLSENGIEVKILSWDQYGPVLLDQLVVSARHDRNDLVVEFKKRFSYSSKEAKTQKILLRDQAIIEADIEEFDRRLYEDLCSGKYDYGYLRRLISKRRKTRADWSKLLSDTKSMMKPNIHFDVIDYALAARDIFVDELENGHETPLHLRLILRAISICSEATVEATMAQLTTTYIAALFQIIEAYCSEDQATKFKQLYTLFLLNRRNDTFDCDVLANSLTKGEIGDLNEEVMQDDSFCEHIHDAQFSPLVSFWKYPELTPTQLTLYHHKMTGNCWPILQRIAFGGYQVVLQKLEVDQKIIPLSRRNESCELESLIEKQLDTEQAEFSFNKKCEASSGFEIWTENIRNVSESSTIVLTSEQTYKGNKTGKKEAILTYFSTNT